MAVTAAGTPYVESSDNVADYPGVSLSLANRVDQVTQAPTQNAQTGTTYTAVLLDAGKTVTLSNAAAVTLTIPAQASVSWADNTQLNFLNIGAGTVTITPAAGVTINGTPLTLETSKGGSLVRTASNTWTFTPTGGAGGKILQVVFASHGTQVNSTSSTYADTGLTATITPASASNKILCISVQNGVFKTVANIGMGLRLMRDATVIQIIASYAAYDNSAGDNLIASLTGSFLDSPATTSAVVYKSQFNRAAGASGTVTVQSTIGSTQPVSTMVLMEVSA